MKRYDPNKCYRWFPCSVCAVGSALGIESKKVLETMQPYGLHDDGYLSLDFMNKYVRQYLPVTKKEVFKKGERPCLRDFLNNQLSGRAIICVSGHYVYAKNKKYISFFPNGNDEVICVWYLRR